MPTIERKDLNELEAQLTVKLPKEEYLPKLDAELRKFKGRAQMRGFRKGMTPMPLIKKMYGQGVMAETVNDLTIKALYEHLKDTGVNILFQPIAAQEQERIVFDVNRPEDFSFKFDIGIEPAWEVNGLSKDTVFEKLVVSNLPELAEEDLQFARRRLGQRVQAENDIQPDDVVKIRAREAGKADGHETDITVYLRSLSDQSLLNELLSKKKGDAIRFRPRLVEPEADEKSFRKYVLGLDETDKREVSDAFEGEIVEVSRIELAEENQDFYDKYFGEGAVSSHDAAMERFQDNIKNFYSGQAEGLLMRDFQQRLLQLNQMPLPEGFLKRWLASQSEENTPDVVERGFPSFISNLRWTLLRERLKSIFDIKIEQKDIEKEIRRRVLSYFAQQGMTGLPEQLMEPTVKKLLADEKQINDAEESVLYEKLFDGILERVSTVDKPITAAELQQLLEAAKAQNKLETDEVEAFEEL